MKDKAPGYPILFSTPMVRPLLTGVKTQTRRIAKIPTNEVMTANNPFGVERWFCDGVELSCPFGEPGGLLYVREDFRISAFYDRMPPGDVPKLQTLKIYYEADGGPLGVMGKKRENMYMPRWMSRLTLELVSVRLERLQDITDADCIAEGIDRVEVQQARRYMEEKMALQQVQGFALRGGSPQRYVYARLWDMLHGPGSWQINPFVWRLEFKAIEGNINDILQERASHDQSLAEL